MEAKKIFLADAPLSKPLPLRPAVHRVYPAQRLEYEPFITRRFDRYALPACIALAAVLALLVIGAQIAIIFFKV